MPISDFCPFNRNTPCHFQFIGTRAHILLVALELIQRCSPYFASLYHMCLLPFFVWVLHIFHCFWESLSFLCELFFYLCHHDREVN